MKPIVAPSILAADFAYLQKAVVMINQSAAQWIHVDIMDGVFVPNISFGLSVCRAVANHAKKPLDVHLMVVQPEKYLQAFKDAGAKLISVHIEACIHLHRVISEIKHIGCQAGVAVNPHTPIGLLEDIITELNFVCLMGVNPGFSGQSFIENTYEKIRKLKNLIREKKAKTLIEIDGGVNDKNARSLIAAGADILVAGSYVFKAHNPHEAISNLMAVEKYLSV